MKDIANSVGYDKILKPYFASGSVALRQRTSRCFMPVRLMEIRASSTSSTNAPTDSGSAKSIRRVGVHSVLSAASAAVSECRVGFGFYWQIAAAKLNKV